MKKKISEKIKDKKYLPVGMVLSSMITLTSIAAGMTSILLAAHGYFEKAVIAIILAAVLDGFDGRVARMFKAASQFGVELDSLADSISFGVAPAFVLYFFSASEVKSLGWVVVVVYAICCVLRLARFNTMTGDEKVPVYWNYFFTGVPAPAGGLLALTPMFLFLATENPIFKSPYVIISFLIVVGFLMVSRVPTLSLKKMRIPNENLIAILVLFAIVLVFLYLHFWYVISLMGIVYVLTIPYTVYQFLKMKRLALKK